MHEFDAEARSEQHPLRGVLAILLVGLALSVVYNWRGQQSKPNWGLSWIGEDRAASMPTLGQVAAGSVDATDLRVESNDPMAIAGGAGVPEVPDLDRPIQVEMEAAKRFHDADAALFVDAREPDEFAVSHISGAVNIPYDLAASEPERIEQLDSGGRPIIVYCGGGTCELSMNLAYDMIFAGHSKLLVYMGGFPEWEGAGYPLTFGGGGE